MPAYSTGHDTWLTSSPRLRQERVMTFEIDTSPSIFSKVEDPIIRINPTPAPEDYSSTHPSKHAQSSHRSKMPTYDDPAFSTDPRSNPHFVPHDGHWFTPPPYSDVANPVGATPSRDPKSAQPFPHTPTNVPKVTPPFASNEDSPTRTDFASLFTPTRSKQSATPPETPLVDPRPPISPPDQSGQGRQRRKSAQPSPPRDLDRIDELDESDPFGTRYHHRGPYQTANEAFTAPKSSRDGVTAKQPRPLQRIPHQPLMPIEVSIGLVPGQIVPKMPYQPRPPANYMSPPPTFEHIYPSPYPYDIPALPHLSPPFHYTNMPDPGITASVPLPASQFAHPPPFPIPQHHNPDSIVSSPPPSRPKRHSFPAHAQPSMHPQENHSRSSPGIRRTPSNPMRVPPRENAPPLPPPPSPDIPLPPGPVRAAPTTKPAPRHVPRRLVMPTPLQQQQQVAPRQPNYPPINDGYVRGPESDDYSVGVSHGQGQKPLLSMPRAQDIPMIQEHKISRRLVKKKTISGASGVAPVPATGFSHSKLLEGPNDVPWKETPLNEQSGWLFKGSDKTESKLGRKLSKRR